MKVLITGGAGFVGGQLAKELCLKGHTVDIVDNFNRGVYDSFILDLVSNKSVKIFNVDLLDDRSLDKFDADYNIVFHLAAIIGVTHVMQRPLEVLTANVRMTENVVALSKRQKKLHRLVFASTSEVYAGSLIHLQMAIPTPESTPLALTSLELPRTTYMLSKIYGEALLNMSGLPITNLRLHNVYGPRMGMSHVVPELIKKTWQAGDGDYIEVYNVDHRRSFCFIDDAIKMISALALSSESVGMTVNVGNDSPEISMGEVAELIAAVVGRKVRIKPIPSVAGSPTRRCPDTTLLKKLTGITSEFTLKMGVKISYDWYRETVFEKQGISAK